MKSELLCTDTGSQPRTIYMNRAWIPQDGWSIVGWSRSHCVNPAAERKDGVEISLSMECKIHWCLDSWRLWRSPATRLILFSVLPYMEGRDQSYDKNTVPQQERVDIIRLSERVLCIIGALFSYRMSIK